MTDKSSNKQKILQKKLELRRELWPDIKDGDLWTHKQRDGFIPVPRVMPLVLKIMDDMAKCPVSKTYFDLWCRKFDEQYLVLNRPQREYAFFAGYSGQRGEQTWRTRMRMLAKLGFIKVESGSYGEFSYVLIVNPIKVIQTHVEKNTSGLRKDYVNALSARGNEVRAKGLAEKIEPDLVPVLPTRRLAAVRGSN